MGCPAAAPGSAAVCSAFTKLTGRTFSQIKTADPGIASYLPIAERGYALHELTFVMLFLVLIAIPFRHRQC